jgi:ATP-dependent Clp protease, protease subunit
MRQLRSFLTLTSLVIASPLVAQTTSTATVLVAEAAKSDPLQSIKDEIAKLTTQKDKLTVELALAQATLEKELSGSKLNVARLQAELAELKARQELADYQTKLAQDKELVELKKSFEKASLESNLAKAQAETEASEIRRIENSTKRDVAKLLAEQQLESQQAESRNYATADPIYLKEPLQGRKLVMSDRRIPLNGPIGMTTADNIVARINYFNNRDRESPIFIVIDDSPGGSVMAGYKILKAMEGSAAPVHVVVKSFAASMAACITTLAKKSYAYPNSVIMHHQLSSFAGGNLTQQQEWVKEMEEWWKRLADPVAQKMGITREEFIKQMYAKVSTGDWNEFGDKAQQLKWVDVIVDQIEETGTLKNPDTNPPPSPLPSRITMPGHDDLVEQTDEKGQPYMILPRLNPLDCYWLYNPDGYFRAR